MSTDGSPRWRRLGPDERRNQILACAVRLFGERPYAAVSTTEIAAEAGVARGLLNHYFGTKRDLYLEVVRTMLFVPPIEEMNPIAGDTGERVRAAIGWLVDVIEAHGHSWVAFSGAEGASTDPEVRKIHDEADDLAAERVLDIIGFVGTEHQRQVVHATARAFGGLVKAVAREIIDRKSLTSELARRQLTAALIAMLDTLDGGMQQR